jgi:hypothetical protein
MIPESECHEANLAQTSALAHLTEREIEIERERRKEREKDGDNLVKFFSFLLGTAVCKTVVCRISKHGYEKAT